jgi:hypothetical protein
MWYFSEWFRIRIVAQPKVSTAQELIERLARCFQEMCSGIRTALI